MGKIISIVSGKGGVGKTVITANLGATLALLRKKVILIDGDLGLRNLDMVMGLDEKVMYNIVDVLYQNCKLSEAVIRDKRFSNLYLLPTAQYIEKNRKVNKEKLKLIYDCLKSQFDYCLIDTPTGLNENFQNSIYGVDEAIVVLVQNNCSILDGDKVIRTLREEGVTKCKILFNKYQENLSDFNIEYISEDLATDMLGYIHLNPEIESRANEGILIRKDNLSLLDKEFIKIANKIIEN